ncbi:MAG: Gfo/Idh/MocA family oxidoreductase [Rhodocyclaceae bacterium]|nr:MAG: Gfo/Idh/MocA family oxidoreductase [Rhodocyclaceae bacterium]
MTPPDLVLSHTALASGQPPLRLGFIGGALDSAVGYAHHTAATMDRCWTVDAGAFSLHSEQNAATAAAYGVPASRTHSDWRAMLQAEQGKLDALVVLTPTPTHAEVVSAALGAGYPVICEKALATTSAEARQIEAARNAAKGFLAVTYNYSGYPMVRQLRHMIRDGKLGRILHFQAEMPQEGFIRTDPQGNKPKPQAWRLKDGSVPTIHLDLAVHLHHLIHTLTGLSPLEVVADQTSQGWFPGVIDDVMCLARYQQDVRGHIWFSKSSLGHRNGLRLRLYGSKAAAEWFQMAPEEVLISHADGHREILDRAGDAPLAAQARYTRFKAGHPAGFIEAFANLYRDIAGCLRQHQRGEAWQTEDVYDARLAIEGLTMLEAMVKSATSRQWEPTSRP